MSYAFDAKKIPVSDIPSLWKPGAVSPMTLAIFDYINQNPIRDGEALRIEVKNGNKNIAQFLRNKFPKYLIQMRKEKENQIVFVSIKGEQK